MTDKSVEKEVLNLETKFWQAIKDHDIEAMADMTDDPCLVTGPMGIHNLDKTQFRKIMQSSTQTLHDFQLKDTQVRLLRDDIAIVAYNVREELTIDGRRLSLDATDTSTWIKRDGRWLCALHSEALPGDPYGRDRKAA